MFESTLAKEMTAYMELRELSVSQTSFLHDRHALTMLDRYLLESGFSGKALTEEILEAWVLTLTGKSKTIKEKVRVIRNFSKYLSSIGQESFLLDSPKEKSDYIPYIYSDEEIQKILYYADNFQSKNSYEKGAMFQLEVPMLVRILYGCGTRLGETISLQRKDVDFKNGTLFLRNTKFSKERLIPVHESLLVILERYCMVLGILAKPDDFLFPGRNPSRHYTTRQMDKWFSGILRLADIDQRNRPAHERGACLHCFRHVFVLKSMQQLEAAGRPVDMNDLLLPTYLGHECLIDTDKYMRFSGVQVPEVLDAFEAYTAGLLPRIEAPYAEE